MPILCSPRGRARQLNAALIEWCILVNLVGFQEELSFTARLFLSFLYKSDHLAFFHYWLSLLVPRARSYDV